MEYEKYLMARMHSENGNGFEPAFLPDYLFDFQKFFVEKALRKGRFALFEDCGLGKAVQALVWAENIYKKKNKPVLILTPLAVTHQLAKEAEKFGLECSRLAKNFWKPHKQKIVTANYENLAKLDPEDYSGLACDESSIIKNFGGVIRRRITEFVKKIEYRLLTTATAAPNDFTEFGTSSEALGYLGHIDMLNRFFKNDNNNTSFKRHFGQMPKWRFRGHAEIPFWRWMTSWAAACRRPSDYGFDDNGFILPELVENSHVLKSAKDPASPFLFSIPANDLREQREEKRRTVNDRCEKVLEIVSGNVGQTAIWCHLNIEGDCLEKIIPDSVQISGKDSDDRKEDVFVDFANGNIKNLITKPKIGGFGMNWQNCSNMVTFVSHSYEMRYQTIRRFWRFGQKNRVRVDTILTEGEIKILNNVLRKREMADRMFDNMISEMTNAENFVKIEYKTNMIMPSFIKG